MTSGSTARGLQSARTVERLVHLEPVALQIAGNQASEVLLVVNHQGTPGRRRNSCHGIIVTGRWTARSATTTTAAPRP